jgi:hypothetical protein
MEIYIHERKKSRPGRSREIEVASLCFLCPLWLMAVAPSLRNAKPQQMVVAYKISRNMLWLQPKSAPKKTFRNVQKRRKTFKKAKKE